jgi:hypothetical protein
MERKGELGRIAPLTCDAPRGALAVSRPVAGVPKQLRGVLKGV